MRAFARSVLPLVLLTVATTLAAQTGTVRGRGVDSAGTALSGTTVTVEGTGLRGTSGPGGNTRSAPFHRGRARFARGSSGTPPPAPR
jgi:hypothetical protein